MLGTYPIVHLIYEYMFIFQWFIKWKCYFLYRFFYCLENYCLVTLLFFIIHYYLYTTMKSLCSVYVHCECMLYHPILYNVWGAPTTMYFYLLRSGGSLQAVRGVYELRAASVSWASVPYDDWGSLLAMVYYVPAPPILTGTSAGSIGCPGTVPSRRLGVFVWCYLVLRACWVRAARVLGEGWALVGWGLLAYWVRASRVEDEGCQRVSSGLLACWARAALSWHTFTANN